MFRMVSKGYPIACIRQIQVGIEQEVSSRRTKNRGDQVAMKFHFLTLNTGGYDVPFSVP